MTEKVSAVSDFVLYPRANMRLYRVCLLILVVWGLAMTGLAVANDSEAASKGEQAATATQERNDARDTARGIGNQVVQGGKCQSADPQDVADFKELCDQVKQIAQRPDPSAADLRELASAVAVLVRADLPRQVEAAVSKYMTQHPTASPDEVRDWVRQEVAANPPVPGPAGQNGEPGTNGDRGPAGPAPTDAQIDAALVRWLDAHPPNVCPGVWMPRLAPDGVSYYRCEVPVPLPPS